MKTLLEIANYIVDESNDSNDDSPIFGPCQRSYLLGPEYKRLEQKGLMIECSKNNYTPTDEIYFFVKSNGFTRAELIKKIEIFISIISLADIDLELKKELIPILSNLLESIYTDVDFDILEKTKFQLLINKIQNKLPTFKELFLAAFPILAGSI